MKKVLLIILDGWGHSEFGPTPDPGNAVEQADVPRFRKLLDEYPTCRLACSGVDVGLPPGQMGNSEVGHLNVGAGRVVYQSIARVDKAAADGTLADALRLPAIVEELERTGRALHVIGLVSDGGVHSHIRHLHAILDSLPTTLDVRIHCITDGRDTSPHGGEKMVREVVTRAAAAPEWRVATVTGRYFAMDRDKRWDRVEQAYRAIVMGESKRTSTNPDFLGRYYRAGGSDEFLPPTVIEGAGERGIEEGDAVIFFNFRADRMRQLVGALMDPDFSGFEREGPIIDSVTTFTEYDDDFEVRVAFPPLELANGLGCVLASHGKRQLRVAETEKYAHVTYFFNGGEEDPESGEDRVMIQSPAVATYDLQPEMSAAGVCAAVEEGIEGGDYDFILVNFANPDMVGHTGVITAAAKAVETVDACLGRLIDQVESRPEWVALVTADHGNCEKMLQEDGTPHTAHTVEPVDFIVCDPERKGASLRGDGRLADVAPTVLEYLGLPCPEEMTGLPLTGRGGSD